MGVMINPLIFISFILFFLIVSPKYVHSIYNRIFLPVKQKTGKFEITEEEFSKFIDGRLGEKEVERKFFK